MAAEPVLECRTGRDQDGDARARDLIQTSINQRQRGRINPMNVLDHEKDGTLASQCRELPYACVKRSCALLLGRELQFAVARFEIQSKESGEERTIGFCPDHERLQPIELV